MDNKIQILIQSYDEKTFVESFEKSKKISEILEDISNKKHLNLKKESIYLTYNGKILNKNKTLEEYFIENNDILFLQQRIKGGIFPLIIGALVLISTFMVTFLVLLEDLIIIFEKLIDIIPLIFEPKKFINDIIFAITFSIRSTFGGMFSSVDSGSSSRNSDLKYESKQIPKVCIAPTLMNLIFLVICPPLALFLDRGITGLFHVIVCSILTVKMYYFPGFIYAALHILC